jgi:hypothetical protein
MKTGVSKNLLGGILFLCIGVVVLIAIPRQIPPPEPGMIGPRYVPNLIAIGLVFTSLILIVQGILLTDGKIRLLEVLPTKEATAIAALIALWIAALKLGTGYLPTTIIFVLLGLVLFKVRGFWNYLIGTAFTVLLFALFAYVLRVRLP